MDLEALSYLISQIAAAIDTGKHQDISIEEVKDRIKKGDLIPYLTEKGVDLNLFVKKPDLADELNEKLQYVLEKFEAQGKKWNVEKNGLCFLIVLTTQIIQSKQKVLTVLQSKQAKERCEIEYKELCKDWRLRDKYVLDKLSAAGILFALLGFAIATVHESEYWIRPLLAAVGIFFSLILCISVFKDILYRDSTKKLIICLYDALGIKNSLKKLGCKYKFDNLEFPRKIRTSLNNTSLKPLDRRIFRWLDQPTFRLIFCFYLFCFLFFLFLFFHFSIPIFAILYEWLRAKGIFLIGMSAILVLAALIALAKLLTKRSSK